MGQVMKEMGGYLPFEGSAGQDRFSPLGDDLVLRVNSAKTALYFAVKSMGVSRVHVPYYCCQSVFHALESAGVELVYHFMDDNLLPRVDAVGDDEAVLVIDYFGVMYDRVVDFAAAFENVIYDFSHSFYARPVMREGSFNVYSSRKFFGVADGGYLIGPSCPHPDIPDFVLDESSFYLVKSLQSGTNSAYSDFQEATSKLASVREGMSQFSRILMSQVDYERVEKARLRNFAELHARLGHLNRLELDDVALPSYVYPLKLDRSIAAELVKKKIYVPALWRELRDERFEGRLEHDMATNVMFLPIDQRYDIDDMDYLAKVVLSLAV